MILLNKRIGVISSKMRVSLSSHMVVTMWSYDSESELRSINALSSLSILTSTIRSSLMTLLKKFRCTNTAIPFVIRSPYSCFLSYSLLGRLFVIYNVSNLDHKPVAVFSFVTLYMTSYARHSWIVLLPFRSIFF